MHMRLQFFQSRNSILHKPVTWFFLLAYAFTWSLLPFAKISIVFSLVALCGPAIAALIVSSTEPADLRAEFHARLLRWRIPLRWYMLAISLPLIASALRCELEYAWGARGAVQFQPVSYLSVVLFVLVAGEEIGWRGFALSKLGSRLGPIRATLVLGVAWAMWHLPLFFMVGMPQYGTPFVAFIFYTIALSAILTCLSLQTQTSVPLATVFHGAVNTLGLVNTEATTLERGWANAICYSLVAVSIAVISSHCRSTNRTST